MKMLVFILAIGLVATVFAYAFYIKKDDDTATKTKKIAQLIGITPSSGKSKLLQNLADIYS